MERKWIEAICTEGPRKGQQFRAQPAYIGWSVQMPDGTLELWAWPLLRRPNYRGVVDFNATS